MAPIQGSSSTPPSPPLGATQQSQAADGSNKQESDNNTVDGVTAALQSMALFMDNRGRRLLQEAWGKHPEQVDNSHEAEIHSAESQDEKALSPFHKIPVELVLMMIGHMDADQKKHLGQTCRYLQQLVEADAVTVKLDTPERLARAAQNSQKIKHIVIDGGDFTEDDLKHMESFKELEQVSLIFCNHETVAAFGSFYSKSELLKSANLNIAMSLSGMGITDETLQKIPERAYVILGDCPKVSLHVRTQLKARLVDPYLSHLREREGLIRRSQHSLFNHLMNHPNVQQLQNPPQNQDSTTQLQMMILQFLLLIFPSLFNS